MNGKLLAGCFALTGIVAALVFSTIGRSEEAGRRGAEAFAAALVGDGPAPDGAAGYVDGVRRRFGAVRSARVVEIRTARMGSGKRARTLVVAGVRLQTAKGTAVIELEFDDQPLVGGSEKITGVRQPLEPA